MTSLARYEFVLVPGPHGVNRVKLLRTPLKQSAPTRDALPLNVPFRPETSTPPLPSWWLARQAAVKELEPQPVAVQGKPMPGDAPSGWCPPDGPALKALRGALPQRKASEVSGLHRGFISDIETGQRSVGKGVSASTLYRYVEALQAHRQAVPDGE